MKFGTHYMPSVSAERQLLIMPGRPKVKGAVHTHLAEDRWSRQVAPMQELETDLRDDLRPEVQDRTPVFLHTADNVLQTDKVTHASIRREAALQITDAATAELKPQHGTTAPEAQPEIQGTRAAVEEISAAVIVDPQLAVPDRQVVTILMRVGPLKETIVDKQVTTGPLRAVPGQTQAKPLVSDQDANFAKEIMLLHIVMYIPHWKAANIACWNKIDA